MDIKTSPIFYMGSKRKLINKGMIELFPNDINRFIDLFSGSGIVSMNVRRINILLMILIKIYIGSIKCLLFILLKK